MSEQMRGPQKLETARERQKLALGINLPIRKQIAEANQRRLHGREHGPSWLEIVSVLETALVHGTPWRATGDVCHWQSEVAGFRRRLPPVGSKLLSFAVVLHGNPRPPSTGSLFTAPQTSSP